MNKRAKFLFAGAFACLALISAGCVTDPGGGPTNVNPVAVATATPSSGTAPLGVVFNSSGSTDSDGTIASVAWDFGDLYGSTAANPSHTYNIPGNYTVTLSVTDNQGGVGSTTLTVNVSAPDDPNGRYVATTGTDSGSCSTSATPCLTINYAVGQAVASNTIYVAAGDYPEMVNPSKALTFKGANAGIAAGTSAGTRGAESTVQGFRTTSVAATAANNFVLDGFEIDPSSDPALNLNATAIVNIFGGTNVSIVNNLFTGAATFAPNCGYTCTDMGDYAIQVRGGAIDISENAFVNWRRPVNVGQTDASFPITAASISHNVFTGITSRAMSVGQNTGQTTMAGVVVDGNVVDSTGRGPSSTPAGITITNNSNQVKNNSFTGVSSGVYLQLCKKFVSNSNEITGNTFTNVGAGVNVTTYLDTSQCNSSMTEGSGGWVVGGGRANGLKVNNNSFATTGSSIIFSPNYGSYTQAVTAGPLDTTCNWYGSAAGPAGGTSVVQGPPTNAQMTVSPWLSTPSGPCDGV